MLYPIGLQRDTSFATVHLQRTGDLWIYRISVNPGVYMPDRTVKLKTPGLTLKRKILGVWGLAPKLNNQLLGIRTKKIYNGVGK